MAECTILRSTPYATRPVTNNQSGPAPHVQVSGPLPVVQVHMGAGGPRVQGQQGQRAPAQRGPLPIVQVQMSPGGPQVQGPPQGPSPQVARAQVPRVRQGFQVPHAWRPMGGSSRIPTAAASSQAAVPTVNQATVPATAPEVRFTTDQLMLCRHLATKHLEELRGSGSPDPVDAGTIALAEATVVAVDAELAALAVPEVPDVPEPPPPVIVVNTAGPADSDPSVPRQVPSRHPMVTVNTTGPAGSVPSAPRRVPSRHPVVTVRMDADRPVVAPIEASAVEVVETPTSVSPEA